MVEKAAPRVVFRSVMLTVLQRIPDPPPRVMAKIASRQLDNAIRCGMFKRLLTFTSPNPYPTRSSGASWLAVCTSPE